MKDHIKDGLRCIVFSLGVGALLFALILLNGCKTQKQTQTAELHQQATHRTDSTATSIQSTAVRDWLATFTASADSTAMTFQADTIVTRDGTRYVAPRFTRHTYAPKVATTQATTDSAHTDIDLTNVAMQTDTVALHTTTTTASQTTAVYTPPSLGRIIFVVLLFFFVCGWMYKNRGNI